MDPLVPFSRRSEIEAFFLSTKPNKRSIVQNLKILPWSFSLVCWDAFFYSLGIWTRCVKKSDLWTNNNRLVNRGENCPLVPSHPVRSCLRLSQLDAIVPFPSDSPYLWKPTATWARWIAIYNSPQEESSSRFSSLSVLSSQSSSSVLSSSLSQSNLTKGGYSKIRNLEHPWNALELTLLIFESKLKRIDVKWRQFMNASSLILSTDDGMQTVCRAHFLNACFPISSTFSGISIDVNFRQLSKRLLGIFLSFEFKSKHIDWRPVLLYACSSISFTEAGTSVETRLEQEKNAESPIFSSWEFGANVMDCKEEPRNASSEITCTDAGISTDVKRSQHPNEDLPICCSLELEWKVIDSKLAWKKAYSSILSTDDGISIEERFEFWNAKDGISFNLVVGGNEMDWRCESEKMLNPSFSMEGGKWTDWKFSVSERAYRSMNWICALRAKSKNFSWDALNADLPIFARDAGMKNKWMKSLAFEWESWINLRLEWRIGMTFWRCSGTVSSK